MLFALAACSLAARVNAIDRIVFETDEATMSAGTGSGVRAVLDLTQAAPRLDFTAAQLQLNALARPFTDVTLLCDRVLVHEPRFACEKGRLRAAGSPVGALAMQARGQFNSGTQAFDLDASGLAIAGGMLAFDLKSDPRGWKAHGHTDHLALVDVRRLARPWITVPKAWQFEGGVTGDFSVSGRASGSALVASIDADVSRFGLTNEAGTVVTQDFEGGVHAQLTGSAADAHVEVALSGRSGQALAGPVFLDLKANPLDIHATGRVHGRVADIEKLAIRATELIDADAHGSVALSSASGRGPHVAAAHMDVHSLNFPAAYTSLLQNRLASTDFGALQMEGRASASFDVENDGLTAFELTSSGIDITDAKKSVGFDGLRAEIHWRSAAGPVPQPSSLAWSRGMLYGISGGDASLSFRTQGDELTLLSPARVPVFDGGVIVNEFRIARPGDASMDLDFDARIDPISMSKLSQAFGWPVLSGSLSGRIPGLRYHDRELAVSGDIEASVFDGTIVARNLRLQDPFGQWPRMFADVTARNLDLDLLTHTFPIGSITGRVNVDMRGLELFNWAPVAFDTKIFTSPNDHSRHRISQRAITSIAGVGGGGGTVARALSSGFLRFFDTFHYDRLGLSCQLRNDVCLMSGIEPTRTGYYIVKGAGLPRIDIIGNAGRVDWPTLLAQLEAGMHSQNIIVR